MQRHNTQRTPFCSGCRKEGHNYSIRNNELSTKIVNTSHRERVDNHPDNENYHVSLRETLEEYRQFLNEEGQSISYKSLKDFSGTKGWRFIPFTLERVLTVCPERIAFLEPKIKQNREAGDRQRMRLAQAVIRGAMTRFWIRRNRKHLEMVKKFAIETSNRIREYRFKANQDAYALKRAGQFQRRSAGYNRQVKKVDAVKQPRVKHQNNGFRKQLDEKWTPETYYEFLMDIHTKTNKSENEVPKLENIYYAVVEKTFGGSWISVLKYQNGILLDIKVNLNPRMFRDWARGKKTAKGQKVHLEGGLLCLVHMDEVIQLYSNREKTLLIEQGIVSDRFEGSIDNIKEEPTKDYSNNVDEDSFFGFEEADSEDSDSEADTEDSVSEADSEESDSSEESEEDEPQPSNLAKFIKPKTGTSKWLCDDSDSEDEESEKPEEPKVPVKWPCDDSDSEDESRPVRQKRLSRAERVSKKQEDRKVQLVREREARKAAARAKEEEIDREISQNFESFLESI
jgi:hypothetical protein